MSANHTSVRPVLVGFLLSLVSFCIFFSGCRCGSPRKTGIHAILGYDTSGGFRNSLAAAANGGASIQSRMDSDIDSKTCYRVANVTEEFGSCKPLASSEDAMKELIAYLDAAPKTDGTYPDKFWALAATRAVGGGKVVIILWSDADNDDFRPESARSICRSAQALAKNRNVLGVIICGASAENRTKLREQFAPLGQRFRFAELGEVADIYSELTSCLK